MFVLLTTSTSSCGCEFPYLESRDHSDVQDFCGHLSHNFEMLNTFASPFFA